MTRSSLPSRGAVPHLPEGVTVNGRNGTGARAVRLSTEQRRAAWVAACDLRGWLRERAAVSRFDMPDPFETDVNAAGAEIAAALVLGVPWRSWRNHEARHDGDLRNGTEVRHTVYATGHLCIYREDADVRPYVLVTGRAGVFAVRGWIRGREAKRAELWRSDWRRPCWAVPQCDLWDIDALGLVIGGNLT